MNFVKNEMPDRNYFECWQAAALHIDALGKKAAETARRPDERVPGFVWQKCDPYGAYMEHLSFYIGAIAVFVQIYDADRKVSFPGTRDRLARIARGFGEASLACLLPMRRTAGRSGHAWKPALPGWGLLDLLTRDPVDPLQHAPVGPVVCTPQELHYFAVNQILGKLRDEGRDILSFNADIDGWPSLFFKEKESPLVSYCAVRHVLHPDRPLDVPPDFGGMRRRLEGMGYDGWFAQVVFRNIDQKKDGPVLPVHRATVVDVDIVGPAPLPSDSLQ